MLEIADYHALTAQLAQEFMNRGWSIIPLCGDNDPDRPKSPAIPSWKVYQQRSPSTDELQHWFEHQEFAAMGIVLGSVSRLVVIDIDTGEAARKFKQHCPDLVDTFTVLSGNRRLPHYYFRLSDELAVPSRSHGGMELRSDGQYVVAPGMMIAGRRWQVINDRKPRILTQADLSRVLALLGSTTQTEFIRCENTPSERVSHTSSSASELKYEGFSNEPISPASLVNRYRRLATEMGRNDALFNVACYARDMGYNQSDIVALLSPVHIMMPAIGAHPSETPMQRQQEANSTIRSAYSRPASIRTENSRSKESAQPYSQLPNSVREKLLQLGLANVARVLDGLLLMGIQAGAALSAAGVYDMLQTSGIGRNTVFNALKTILQSGQAIFKRLAIPPDPPLAYAANGSVENTNQCLFGSLSKPGKNRGRPAHRFVMPDINTLCTLLGVKDSGGDQLTDDALKSPAAYRSALHKALFQRAPGQYPRQWLAKRLGVSEESCRRYERREKIQARLMFRTWTVDWSTLEKTVPSEPTPGTFLQDEQGKRYPPILALARKLLAQGIRLLFCWQDANYYSVIQHNVVIDAIDTPIVEAGLRPAPTEETTASPAAAKSDAYLLQSQKHSMQEGARHAVPQREVIQDWTVEPSRAVPQTPQRSGRETLNDVADLLYQTLRDLNPQRSITRSTARQWVQQYGVGRVKRGLGVLQRRSNIRSPAGFLRIWLQGDSKSYQWQHPGRKPTATNRSSGHIDSHPSEDEHTRWMRRLRESGYASYFANADDIGAD